MHDTVPEVERRMDRLFMQRSGTDRVRMACEMFDLARALVAANITARYPGITDIERHVKIFEQLYGDDFAPDERARIAARLRARK